MDDAPSRVPRLVRAAGWGSVLFAAAIAAFIVLNNRAQRAAVLEQIRVQEAVKLRAAQDRIGDYLAGLQATLSSLAVAVPAHASNVEYLRSFLEAHGRRWSATAVHLLRVAPDGAVQQVVLRDWGAPGEADGPLAGEIARLESEFLARFRAEPERAALISDPIGAADPRQFVFGVPARQGSELAGLVAGVFSSAAVAKVLEESSVGNMLALVSESGVGFYCVDFPARLKGTLCREIHAVGVARYFGERGAFFQHGTDTVRWTTVEAPDARRWYLLAVCDEAAKLAASGVPSTFLGSLSAGVVLLLGGAVGFLCRATLALRQTRQQADGRAGELQASEERFRAIVAAMPLPVVISRHPEGTILYANEHLGTLVGVPSHELIGQRTVNFYADPAQRDGVLARIEREDRIEGLELALRKADGSVIWVLASVGRMTYRGAPALVGGFYDLTERKRMEAQLQQRQAELAHVARVGTMGELASGLAHEINQPLAAIVNYVQASLERLRLGNAQPADVLDDMQHAAAQAERASEIIDHIREFIRKRAPKYTTVSLNALAREAAELVEAEARQKRVALRLELAPDLPPVAVEPIQIEQVIVNLLRNGFDALATGPVGRRQVTVRTAANGDGVVECSVTDSGPGLPDGEAERLFEPFFTTKPLGMGMGLSISRTIIESHQGRLSGMTNPEGGATFRFVLPAARRTAE